MSTTQNSINNTLATTSLTGILQAGREPAHTGDVTNSAGSLAMTIAAAAVTYAKIQNVGADSLLGNATGSPATTEEITLGSGLAFVGTVLTPTFPFVPMPSVVVTGTSSGMSVNTCYIANNAGTVTLTLPATAALSTELMIEGLGAGGWTLAQNAGQLVQFGNQVTTTGTGGSIASKHFADTLHIKCVVANTTWTVHSSQGNMTVT